MTETGHGGHAAEGHQDNNQEKRGTISLYGGKAGRKTALSIWASAELLARSV